jgi:hypothetical protein
MARILSDETTLTRKRQSLARESEILRRISYAEAAVAVLLVAAGVGVYLVKGTAGWLIIGGIASFLAVGHFLKIRENEQERRHVTAGLKGEVEVTQLLQSALDNDTYIFNDLNVKHGARRSQIDHVVVSPKGLFVIETKNWRGALDGDEKERQWSQVRQPGMSPVRVSNPIAQNARHIEVLAEFLKRSGVDWPDVHSIVVMTSPSSTWTIRNQTVPVFKPAAAVEHIAGFQPERVHAEAEVDAVINLFMRSA